MDKPFYDFEVRQEATRFEFTSVGKRAVRKIIAIQETTVPGFFNVLLGDSLPNGEVDVYAVSDNGDRDKILATVAQAMNQFLLLYPDAYLFFVGSTSTRTRLYQMAISHAWDSISNQFEVVGLNAAGQLVPFERNQSYEGFVVSRKDVKLTL
jgi:hypothetical protein